jgi:hypothetical protein
MANHAPDWSGDRVQKAAPGTDMDDFIVDAYTETLLAVRGERRLLGDAARSHACIVAAARVSAATGRAITPEMVARLTKPWW